MMNRLKLCCQSQLAPLQIGKVENTERFTRLAMFQGVPKKDKRARGSGKDVALAPEKDPTLVCSAYGRGLLRTMSRTAVGA